MLVRVFLMGLDILGRLDEALLTQLALTSPMNLEIQKNRLIYMRELSTGQKH